VLHAKPTSTPQPRESDDATNYNDGDAWLRESAGDSPSSPEAAPRRMTRRASTRAAAAAAAPVIPGTDAITPLHGRSPRRTRPVKPEKSVAAGGGAPAVSGSADAGGAGATAGATPSKTPARGGRGAKAPPRMPAASPVKAAYLKVGHARLERSVSVGDLTVTIDYGKTSSFIFDAVGHPGGSGHGIVHHRVLVPFHGVSHLSKSPGGVLELTVSSHDLLSFLEKRVKSQSKAAVSAAQWTPCARWDVAAGGSGAVPPRASDPHTDRTVTIQFATPAVLERHWVLFESIPALREAIHRTVHAQYDIRSVVNKGSFGVVHLALRRTDGLTVAVKEIPKDGLARAELDRLENEYSLLRRLHHPAIVSLIDVFDQDDALFIVTEFIAGGDLLELVTEAAADNDVDDDDDDGDDNNNSDGNGNGNGSGSGSGSGSGGGSGTIGTAAHGVDAHAHHQVPRSGGGRHPYWHPPSPQPEYGLGEPTARCVMRQLLGALVYMHRQRVIHRDIKLENVLVCARDPAGGGPGSAPPGSDAFSGSDSHVGSSLTNSSGSGSGSGSTQHGGGSPTRRSPSRGSFAQGSPLTSAMSTVSGAGSSYLSMQETGRQTSDVASLLLNSADRNMSSSSDFGGGGGGGGPYLAAQRGSSFASSVSGSGSAMLSSASPSSASSRASAAAAAANLASEADILRVKLCDFGTARTHGVGNRAKTYTGTTDYFAPEVLRVDRAEIDSYDEACDMWSLGVCLFAMLRGALPFWEDRVIDGRPVTMPQQIMGGMYSFEHDAWESVSENAKDVVRGLLSVDPAQRLSAAEALAHPWMRGENGSGSHGDDGPAAAAGASGCAIQ
jgi:serine/threonine protein kinase